MFHGWYVVATCFVIASVSWGLALYGSSVYLQVLSSTRGWPLSDVSAAVSAMYLVGASLQRPVARLIGEHGARPVLAGGVLALSTGVALLGQARAAWQLFPCFALIGVGWGALSTTALSATVAPWFERHQGRSITLAIMGASAGAILVAPLLLALIGALGTARGLAVAAVAGAAFALPPIALVLGYRGPEAIGQRVDGAAAAQGAPDATAGFSVTLPALREYECRRRRQQTSRPAGHLTHDMPGARLPPAPRGLRPTARCRPDCGRL